MPNSQKMRLLCIVAMLLLLVANVFVCHYAPADKNMSVDTLRTTFVDTIPYYKPVPKDSFVITYITKILPVASQDSTPAPSNDTIRRSDSADRDSIAVQIPITQKVYRDSSYTAYVSGYQPSMDSIVLHIPHSVTVITNTIRLKQSRWSIGLQVGYGINLSPTPRYAPYIGIGLQYSLFRF